MKDLSLKCAVPVSCILLLTTAMLLPAQDRLMQQPKKALPGTGLTLSSPELLDEVDMFTEEAARSVEQGLVFLSESQNRDGSFGGQYRVAETSLVGMAYLAAGNGQGRGPYAKSLRRAVDYLFTSQDAKGYYSDGGYSRMHGHGFAMLFLAQVCGMNSQSPAERAGLGEDYQKKLKESVAKAVDLAVESQTDLGGWNYEPNKAANFDEASITICIVQGLRAAQNAGISVPKETIERAVGYVVASYDDHGSFAYSLRQNIRRPSFALSAAGLSTLVAAGEYDRKDSKMAKECLEAIKRYRPDKADYADYYYYYAQFYAAQAMYQFGGDEWENWYPAVREDLLKRKRTVERGKAAIWESNVDIIYGTAMACLILQVPNNYLPIFQR